MRIFDPPRKNTARLRVAALVLLVVALVIPQLTWADHASDHPDSQVGNLSSISSSAAYAALVGKYKTGDLVFNTPGRRDDRSFGISPSGAYGALVEKYGTGDLVFNTPGRRDDRSFGISPSGAYGALVEKYGTGELVYHAPGRRDDRLFTAPVNPEQIDAAFLAANPETMVSRRYAASRQAVAEAANSARWVALGEYYTSMGTTFLAANPEIMVYRRYVASGQTDAALLAANPEVMTYRRFVLDGCSEAGQVC
jgi:hypothetical protein